MKLEDVRTIDKWFRVDSKPFKQNLLNTVKKWSLMFKQHLMDDVMNSLKELDEFIKVKDVHLAKEVKEGDYHHLVSMMGHLGDVREKTTQYDNMFEPIKQKIELLKLYGQEVPDDVFEKLQVLEFLSFFGNNFRVFILFWKMTIALAREVEQHEEVGYASEATSGTAADQRGCQCETKDGQFRCGAVQLPRSVPSRRTVQIRQRGALQEARFCKIIFKKRNEI